MMWQPWWIKWGGLLELELASLRAAGIPFERDEKAFADGYLVLHIHPTVEGERIDLVAIFPDFYPYLRPEVIAPALGLQRHQNPASRSLCLIGRSTANWQPGDTLAGLLKSQLHRLLRAARSDDPSQRAGLEEPQGEPYSDYYPYSPDTMIIVDSAWKIPSGIERGTVRIGVDFKRSTASATLRGAVLEILDNYGNRIAEAAPFMHGQFSRTISAPWRLLPRPISVQPGGGFGIPAEFAKPHFQPVGCATIDVAAILFPEEVAANTTGLGWVFVLRVKRPGFSRSNPRPYIVRAGRAGKEDMAARVPELKPMQKLTVAIFGLGALGAPSAFEMARAGIGNLHVLDHDFVDPATAVRWPLGFSAAGRMKTDAVAEFIRQHYPQTTVRRWLHRLGSVRGGEQSSPTDLDVVKAMFQGADLVYDATAELGIQHLLSDLCREAGIPYICVSASEGGWGGLIVRVRPNASGCWLCVQHAIEDKSLPLPPFHKIGTMQPIGCANPTFTGNAFDLGEISLGGVRLMAATLCSGSDGGYPDFDWDVASVALRTPDGRPIAPRWETFSLQAHPSCEACARRAA